MMPDNHDSEGHELAPGTSTPPVGTRRPSTPGSVLPEHPDFLWRTPDPKPSYDVIIVGGGGHGLATAHYLVRVMWALLKRGTVWEEDLALANEPGTVARAAGGTEGASWRRISPASCRRAGALIAAPCTPG